MSDPGNSFDWNCLPLYLCNINDTPSNEFCQRTGVTMQNYITVGWRHVFVRLTVTQWNYFFPRYYAHAQSSPHSLTPQEPTAHGSNKPVVNQSSPNDICRIEQTEKHPPCNKYFPSQDLVIGLLSSRLMADSRLPYVIVNMSSGDLTTNLSFEIS